MTKTLLFFVFTTCFYSTLMASAHDDCEHDNLINPKVATKKETESLHKTGSIKWEGGRIRERISNDGKYKIFKTPALDLRQPSDYSSQIIYFITMDYESESEGCEWKIVTGYNAHDKYVFHNAKNLRSGKQTASTFIALEGSNSKSCGKELVIQCFQPQNDAGKKNHIHSLSIKLFDPQQDYEIKNCDHKNFEKFLRRKPVYYFTEKKNREDPLVLQTRSLFSENLKLFSSTKGTFYNNDLSDYNPKDEKIGSQKDNCIIQ